MGFRDTKQFVRTLLSLTLIGSTISFLCFLMSLRWVLKFRAKFRAEYEQFKTQSLIENDQIKKNTRKADVGGSGSIADSYDRERE